MLAAGGYPDTTRRGDVIHGLDDAAKLPGKVFHAGTALDGDAVEQILNPAAHVPPTG